MFKYVDLSNMLFSAVHFVSLEGLVKSIKNK